MSEALYVMESAVAKPCTSFELLTKAIYEEILSTDGYETVSVEHDVKVLGRSGQLHQIDVYWEFKIAGLTHRVAVECKEYSNTVSVGKVRDFYGALEDIGNIHGVFVTTQGYQSGAITYAEHKNISLKVVSEPSQEDIDNHQGIKEIHFNINALCISNVEFIPEFDNEWLIKNTELKKGDTLEYSGMSNELKVLDVSYNLIGTLHDLGNKLSRTPENTRGLVHKQEFTEAFLFIPRSKYPAIKLKSIIFKYDTYTISTKSEMRFKLLAEAVLKDIITGETHLYKKQALQDDV